MTQRSTIDAELDAALEALSPHRVPDAVMARAWDKVGDLARARIKTCQALLYAVLRGSRRVDETTVTRFQAGCTQATRTRPRPIGVYVLADPLPSGVELAAAISPAIMAEVPRLAAVAPKRSSKNRVRWDEAAAALELAGVEDVFTPPKTVRKGFLDAAAQWGGVVVGLGGGVDALPWDAAGNVVRLESPQKLFVLDPKRFDRETLAAVHPNAEIELPGDEDLLIPNHPGVAVYAAGHRLEALLENLPEARLFGPGRECAWFWPELGPTVFLTTARALW